MINCQNVSVEYRLDKTTVISALTNVSFNVKESEYIAVIGPNGSGKSTLALCLSGLLQPSSGTVYIDGAPLGTAVSNHTIHTTVGIVFQNPDNQLTANTVEREVAFALENRAIPREEMIHRVDAILKQFSIEDLRYRSPYHLSGGQKQKAALAAVMVSNPKYLILDEPTSYLDASDRRIFLHQLRLEFAERSANGFAIVLITQFSYEAVQCNRIIVLNKGEVITEGIPDYIFGECQEVLNAVGVEIPAEYHIKKVFPGIDLSADSF
jgi:energy-coupling factor transporter ATP-binding protein EcfA2